MAFPQAVTRSAGNQQTTNSLTHTPTLPASIVNGNLLIAWGAIDASPVVTINAGSGAGWTLAYRAQNSATVTGVLAWKVANGTDTLIIDTDTTEQSSWRTAQYSGAGTPTYPTSANWAVGSSTNSDPPNHDTSPAAAADNLWLALSARDAQVANTGYPANYTQGQLNITATNAAGATTGWAERELNAQAENPGAFTSGSEQWVCCTVAIPPATAKTVDTDGGSYAIAGTAASVEMGRMVAADGATYAISGQAASLQRGFEVAATGGSYAIAGQAATFDRAMIVATDGGSYAIAGSDAALAKGQTVVADAGSYAISGQAATFDRTYLVAADGAAYALAGQTASLEHGYEVAATGGSYALSGASASLELGRSVAAETVAYTIAGQDVALAKGQTVDAAAGSYALDGSDVSLDFAYLVDAEGGSYEIAGSVVELQYGEPEPEPEPIPAPSTTQGRSGGFFRPVTGRLHWPKTWPKKKRDDWERDTLAMVRGLLGTVEPEDVAEALAPHVPEEIDPRAVRSVVRAMMPDAPFSEVRAVTELILVDVPFDPIEIDNDLMMWMAML
jgi:hypothetical protein